MAKITVKIVKDIDQNKLRALVKQAGATGQHVNVGYPAGVEEVDGTSVAMIAAVHNFGSPARGIPERPFMTQAILNNENKIVELNRNNLLKIIKGDMATDQALGQLGVFAVGLIQQEIKKGHFTPLKDATIERKGSSRPLIDTAQMMQSTTYVIEGKK